MHVVHNRGGNPTNEVVSYGDCEQRKAAYVSEGDYQRRKNYIKQWGFH